MIFQNKHKTLYEVFFPVRNVLLDMFFIACSVGMLTLFANIKIPLWPVPVTLQTFGVFLIAFFFGSKKGVLTIISYLLAGLFGLGVFAGYKSGYGTFIGPTAGYLVGFVFMALVVGLMIEKGFGRNWKSVLLCLIVGEVVLYIFGLSGLWLYLGNVSLVKVLTLGFVPFVIGDVLKAILAVSLFPVLWKGEEKIKN